MPDQGQARPTSPRNFSEPEIDLLLSLVDEHMPIGEERWKLVGHFYEERALENCWCARDWRVLKRKYERSPPRQLARAPPKPTNPSCISRAQAIETEIRVRAELEYELRMGDQPSKLEQLQPFTFILAILGLGVYVLYTKSRRG
ncbi:hypothetical protein D9611_003646 [Ephemerocybe angulata]|uniref:Uncharacterized protein n=1 Tax=Ephemerocybe angulata TaxID=980116 RepID=A0A8H5B5N9_9AGAR|nr:hypothetical protein D9611_003646 [Tulosesus angulatus]